MLFHVSEEPGIRRFEPRPAAKLERPVAWAIDAQKLRNYLLRRDCPRVTFFAGPHTSADDVERFLGASPAVVAVESAWLDRIRAARLFCYVLPDDSFRCVDACAGYYHSHEPVVPLRVDAIADALGAIVASGAELRVMPTLWPLRDAVIASTLEFSIIRIQNAAPRPS